jgi:hypothetical protein
MINFPLKDKMKLRNRDFLLNLFAHCLRENITIFRIEHDTDKHGPYVTEDYKQWREHIHSDIDGQPLSDRDPAFKICFYDLERQVYPDHDISNYYSSFFEQLSLIAREEQDYILFGFETMEQLKAWFSPAELNKILKMGYSIQSYKVKRAFISGHQAFFFSSDSTWKR